MTRKVVHLERELARAPALEPGQVLAVTGRTALLAALDRGWAVAGVRVEAGDLHIRLEAAS